MKTNNYKWVVEYTIGYLQSAHVFNTADAAVNFAETITESYDAKYSKWNNHEITVVIKSITTDKLEELHKEFDSTDEPNT